MWLGEGRIPPKEGDEGVGGKPIPPKEGKESISALKPPNPHLSGIQYPTSAVEFAHCDSLIALHSRDHWLAISTEPTRVYGAGGPQAIARGDGTADPGLPDQVL